MRRSSVFASVSATALLLAGCVAPSEPPPRPAPPVAVPTPAPTPAPAPPPASADWRDWPYSPGTWSYRADATGGVASFGFAGQPAELTLRCDQARGRILLSRRSLGGASSLTIRTTSVARTLTAAPAVGTLAVDLGARDTLIDALGYSRGRFVVEGGAMPTLVVPSWAEILRVAEDCRG